MSDAEQMKTLTDQLRALAVAPEFEETSTAKLFLEIATRAERIERENAKLREALRWAMVRIESRCPHAASEGDSELYRFVEAKALTR